MPACILLVVFLILLGVGLMRPTDTVHERHHPHEVAGTRQRVGDTEIRRSKLESAAGGPPRRTRLMAPGGDGGA